MLFILHGDIIEWSDGCAGIRLLPTLYWFWHLGFGFMLPEKIEHPERKGAWATIYNKVFDNPTYQEKIKPVTDKWLGGTLRLFVEKVYNGSYFNNNDEEVVLSVTASLPNGSTLEQMNVLIKQMETYLSGFQEIRQFQTSIYDARRAGIDIFFKKEYEHGGFPYVLKSNIISKALTLGGGSWNVYGLQDQGFSNDVHESAGSFQVEMYGYNYDELSHWAEEMKNCCLPIGVLKKYWSMPSFRIGKTITTNLSCSSIRRRWQKNS